MMAVIDDHLLLRSGDPAGTRTQDPYIKSVLLYRLSYEIWFLLKSGRKYTLYATLSKCDFFDEKISRCSKDIFSNGNRDP